ncbi:MAG: hypothetical protein ACERK1_00765 [Anaerolineales bacterium]
MRKKPPITYLLLALVAFFLIGLFSVLIRRNSTETLTTSPSVSTSSRKIILDSQNTILILGVDEAVSPQPILHSIWFVSLDYELEEVSLLGFPTNYQHPESEKTLAESFTWSAISGFDTFDLEPFEDLAPGSLLATIILDEEGFANLIDYVGGITLNGEPLNGRTVIGVMDMLYDQPEASLTMQAKIIQAIIANASDLGSTPELTPLIALIPEDASISQSAPELASLAIPFLPITPDAFDVETWVELSTPAGRNP